MKFLKNKSIIISLIAVFIVFFVFLLCTIFMSNNFIRINHYINTKNITEFVITDDKSNKESISASDKNFNDLKNVLSKSKVYLYSDGLLEYDTKCDVIELKHSKKSKILYTYIAENNKVFVIIKDFFEHADTSKKLDYPFYLVAEIPFSDYYTIFPNSTLLSKNRITTDLYIKNKNNSNNEFDGVLRIRNDNDCAIRLEKINYNDENISVLASSSESIEPHSNYEVEIKIKSKTGNKSILKCLEKSNFNCTFVSTINTNDKCKISNVEYH